jgi:hypothetical protein
MPAAAQDRASVSLLGSSSTWAANVLKVTASHDPKHQRVSPDAGRMS